MPGVIYGYLLVRIMYFCIKALLNDIPLATNENLREAFMIKKRR